MSTSNPYPQTMAVDRRIERLEQRQDSTDVVTSSLTATVAVHTEQIGGFREDVRDVANTFRDASSATNARIDRLLKAVWAAIGLLVPTLLTLAIIAIQLIER